MKLAFLLVAMIMLTPAVYPQSQPKPKAPKAVKPELLALLAAKPWLGLIDDGKYGQSWQTSAQYFQAHITEGQWQSGAAEVRGSLGALLMRKLKSAKFTKSLPGMPDGMYVILQFQSSFENKESAVETVSTIEDSDGEWKVSGYFVK